MKNVMWGTVIILAVFAVLFVISLIYERHHKDDLWTCHVLPWSNVLLIPIFCCALFLLLFPLYQKKQTEFETRIAEGYTVYYEGIEVSSDSIRDVGSYSVIFDDTAKMIIINNQ